MFCTRCGKEIDYDASICRECEAELIKEAGMTSATAQQEIAAQPVELEQPKGSRKEGFGGALAATILGWLGYFVSCINLGVTLGALGELSVAYDPEIAAVFAGIIWVINVVCLGLSVPGLILGIKSMKCFFRAKNEGRVKPIATLILGIVGVAGAALAFMFVLICIFGLTAF